MIDRISRTLHLAETGTGSQVVCAGCGHILGPNGKPWKPHALLCEERMNSLGVEIYTSADEVMLRRFLCPSCGHLLDTEVAVAGDPYLDDVLFVATPG